MKDNHTQNLRTTADAVVAEETNNEEQQAESLGKFRDVQALEKAYQALEAEFTRRSQRLKELEKLAANKGEGETAIPVTQAANSPSPSQPGQNEGQITIEDLPTEVKNAVIDEYLHGVYANRGVPFVTGGGAVTAARQTPTSLREAGALAKNMFDSKEEK